VLIFHPAASSDAGPLVRALAEARRSLAERQRVAFLAAGADEVKVVAGPPDGLSFGERLRMEVRAWAKGRGARAAEAGGGGAGGGGAGGVVVLGSGSIPLARAADLRRFVEVAAGPGGHALANNRYSADVVAVSRAADLAELPPLPADNALPRWLEERAGVAVADLRSHWRLGVDIDTPLDLVVLRDPAAPDPVGHDLRAAAPLVGERLAALSEVLTDRRAELLVAGRVSATTLRWLESGVVCRVRALVEERGLRAASKLAQSGATTGFRPPRSVLGELLDRDGPESLARTVATLADAAVIDTRVLLAHRHGAGESAWPPAEDRFASDLLLPASIADPWLRTLTASAAGPSPIAAPDIAANSPTATSPSDRPILLGGHTLVNGGLRLLAQRARAGAR
jgi:CTP:molybdopterin cytidylyltransferase MocA